MIKAIDTYYKGYKFRSRLEARWAIFFDEMKIDWVYEPEGYEFENGIKYLPDFYLPKFNSFCEVKPIELNDSEMLKVELLVKNIKKECILLVGAPDYKKYLSICPAIETINDESCDFEHSQLATDNIVGIYEENYYLISAYFYQPSFALTDMYHQEHYEDYVDAFGKDYVKAVEVAKQARFEHGEQYRN